jgi:hypothetical protein
MQAFELGDEGWHGRSLAVTRWPLRAPAADPEGADGGDQGFDARDGALDGCGFVVHGKAGQLTELMKLGFFPKLLREEKS